MQPMIRLLMEQKELPLRSMTQVSRTNCEITAKRPVWKYNQEGASIGPKLAT